MRHVFIGLAALLGGFIGLSPAAHAQGSYAEDALLYSRQNPAGTARTLGLGGASTSLGGDYGSMNTNPAGLGVYTKSEFTFSPGIGIGSATSTPLANAASTAQVSTGESANSFHIASLGLVFTNRRADNDRESDWRGGSFGLGFTRLADFNSGFTYRNTTNDGHSFYQRLRQPGGYTDSTSAGYQAAVADIINNKENSVNNYIDGLAYTTYLTDDYVRNVRGTSYTVLRIAHPRLGAVQQDETVRSKGSLSQFDLGYGGNYRDRLYIGGAIGIVSMNRTRTSSFAESHGGVEDFRLDDYVRTTGTGINARLGVIVRPVDALRLGLSVQTPTYIGLTDEYYTTITTNPSYARNGDSNVLSTPDGTYSYSVTLPFRANGGLTVLFNKYGFLTADVEYVGYGQTRFNPNANDTNAAFSGVNSAIAAGYKNTVNVKVGVEGRLDIFRARLGYARYGNPYTAGTLDRGQNYFTGGLGFRTKSFFLDLTEVYLGATSSQYTPYTLVGAASPLISTSDSRATTTATVGFLF